MKKDVLLCIRGLQFEAEAAQNDEELESIETICAGEYYNRGDAHYILYEENIEDCDEPVKNMLKVKGNEFSLTKHGGMDVQMVFSEGKKTLTNYNTPFGTILIGLDTSKVETTEEDERLRIHIDYALEANYQYIADCHIEVNVTPQNKKPLPASN